MAFLDDAMKKLIFNITIPYSPHSLRILVPVHPSSLAMHILTDSNIFSVLPSKSKSLCSVQISAGVNDLNRRTNHSIETSKIYQEPLKYLPKSVTSEYPKERKKKKKTL
jgi:hypothetical protein